MPDFERAFRDLYMELASSDSERMRLKERYRKQDAFRWRIVMVLSFAVLVGCLIAATVAK